MSIFTISLIVLGIIVFLYFIFRKSPQKTSNTKLYVGNVPYRTRVSDLRRIFTSYGDVESIRIIKDRQTGKSKGFAFVIFKEADEAAKALELNGYSLLGRNIVVRMALEK